MPECRICGVELTDENWYSSTKKINSRICKECHTKQGSLRQKANADTVRERHRVWRKENPDKAKANAIRYTRKQGAQPFTENKECASFLGVHIAERVLSNVFKNIERMPMNNPGYDVICNRDKRIDIKSSCTRKKGGWSFGINRNATADYFLCLAFDNRKDLMPLHAWLLPGSKFGQFSGVGISPSTIHKWDAYRLDISKISDCCDAMR